MISYILKREGTLPMSKMDKSMTLSSLQNVYNVGALSISGSHCSRRARRHALRHSVKLRSKTFGFLKLY